MKRYLLGVLILTAHMASTQEIYNKAKTLLASGDTAGAFSSFQEALKAGQKAALSNYYLGAISFAHHKTDDAITYLLASFKNEDDNVDVIKLLGEAYYEKNDIKNSLTYYRLAAKLSPKDCDITIALGHVLVAADSTDAAIVQLIRSQECMPNNPLIYLSLGDAYYKIGVKPLAITNYLKASELAPKDRDIRLKVARALTANREYGEAIKAYILAEQIDSTYPDTYLEHGKILVRAARSSPEKQKEYYKAAISPLGAFVKLSPKNVEGSVLYAEAFYGSDQNTEAAAAAKASLQLDSSNVDVWRIEAHALAETKDYKGALEAFAALQRRNAIKQQDQIKMGQAYFGAGMDAEAMDAFQKAMASDSANCDIYFPLGSLFMKKQDYTRASEMFEKKVLCDPKALAAYINAAITYMQPSNLNLSRARELLFKSIELKSDFLQGRLWLARYYLQDKIDSLDLAEAQYLEVLKIIGDQIDKNKAVYGEAQKLLGSLYMTKQKYRPAIDAFTKARSVGADDGNVHLSWGQAILQTLDPKPADPGAEAENAKKNQDALEHFATCVKKDPGNCAGHFWLGECYVRSRAPGDDKANAELKRKACEEWRTVLKYCPKNEEAKKGLERISCP